MSEKKKKVYKEFTKHCPVLGCKSNTKTTKRIRFFSFPKFGKKKQYGYLATVWSAFTRRKNFQPNSVEVMCEDHFDPAYFHINQSGKKKKNEITLDIKAVPTIYFRENGEKVVVNYCGQTQQYYGEEAQQLLEEAENFIAEHEEEVAQKRMQKIKCLKNLCRLCFSDESAKTVRMSHLEAYNISPSEVIQLIGVTSQANHLFSEAICEKCFNTIIDFENYRKRCKKSQKDRVNEMEALDKKLREVQMQRTLQKKTEVWFKVKLESDVHEEVNELPEYLEPNNEIEEFSNVGFDEANQMDFSAEVKTEYLGINPKIEPVDEDETMEDSNWNEHESDTEFLMEEVIATQKLPQKNPEKQKRSIESYALRTFECFWCRQMLHGYSKFQSHLKECKREMICDVAACRKPFTNQGAYNFHIMRRHNLEKITRYYCAVCNTNFQMTKTKFDEHCELCIEANQFKEQNIECGICNQIFKTLQGFSAHKIFHGKDNEKNVADMMKIKRGPKLNANGKRIRPYVKQHKQLMCEICSKIFTDHSKLRRHRTDVHFVDFKGVFYCDLCPVTRNTRRLMYVHMKSTHILNEHPCEICEKIFKNRELWRKHQLIHNGAKRNNICPICPHSPGFVTTSALKKHHWKHHGGEQPARPHICVQCGAGYALAHLLVRHQMKVHNL